MTPRSLALFFLSIVLLYFSALGTMPLLEPDEGRYAEIPREMLASGDFVTPHLNGVAYLEKPPLYYWGVALSLRIFGETETGARVFTAAVSAGLVLLTYWMGSVLAGWRTGLFSAIVLSTSVFHYAVGRLNTLDMTLAAALFVAVFPAWLYLSGKRDARGWLVLSYAGMGLSFLAKGLVGIVFPPAILFLWLLVSRRIRELPRALSATGILVLLAIALPWVVLVQRANPDFLWFFFVHEQFLRYSTKIHHRYEPFWFFLPVLVAGFIPWIAFLRRCVAAVRRAADPFLLPGDRNFLLCWILFVLLFFSFSGSKLVTYMTPVFPPLAVLFGRALDLWVDREDGTTRCRAPLALSALFAAAILFLPRIAGRPVDVAGWTARAALPVLLVLAWGIVPLFVRRLSAFRVVLLSFLLFALFLTSINAPAGEYLRGYKSTRDLCDVLNASLRPGDVVAQYRVYKQGIAFYTKRRTVQVDKEDELAFGAARSPDRAEWFIGRDKFREMWNGPARVFCVLGRGERKRIGEEFPGARLLYASDAGILIVNRF